MIIYGHSNYFERNKGDEQVDWMIKEKEEKTKRIQENLDKMAEMKKMIKAYKIVNEELLKDIEGLENLMILNRGNK
jgi:ATP-dependent Zn protease